MECKKVRIFLSDYLEDDLEPAEKESVGAHLGVCEGCRQHAELLKKSWEFLGHLETIQPSEGYISRFWTRISQEVPWHEKWLVSLRGLLNFRKLSPAYTSALVLLIIGLFSVWTFYQAKDSEFALANLSDSDIEMIEYIELAENIDIIDELDILVDFDIIENVAIEDLERT